MLGPPILPGKCALNWRWSENGGTTHVHGIKTTYSQRQNGLNCGVVLILKPSSTAVCNIQLADN